MISDINFIICTFGFQNHCRWWLQPWNYKTLTPWKESYDQPRQHIKKQRHYFVNKGLSSQGYGFSCSHVWMWELDYKESWPLKNWCFWTVVLEKTLWVPWTARRSNQSILKEISPGCSFVGLMLKLKLQYCGHLMGRADSFEKTLMLGKVEAGEEGDEMVEWHHRLNGHEFEWTLGVGDGQGGLVCCGSWCHKELDTTEWLNWTELITSKCDGFVSTASLLRKVSGPHVFLEFDFKTGGERPIRED